MYIRVGIGPEQRFKSEVYRVTVPSIGLGEPSHSLPEVTGVVFRNGNGDTPDPNNCCAICVDLRLGVRQNATASNGMEMIFTLSGHRSGLEYDITRTVRSSIWQRAAGVWARMLRQPMGTPDDQEDRDEWLTRGSTGNWDMDMVRSRIGLGPLSAAIIDSPPA